MFDLDKVLKQYTEFDKYRVRYIEMKKKCSDFYSKNSKELNILLTEFYSLSYDDVVTKAYLREHDVLRRYFHIKFLRDFYEGKKDEVKKDTKLVKHNGRIVKIKDGNNDVCFFDLETKDSISIRKLSEKEVFFIITLLDKANTYIGEIFTDSLALMLNIFDDIKYKNSSKEFTNREIYNEYKRTLQSTSPSFRKELVQKLETLVDEKEKEYKENKITTDEYKIYKYMLVIVQLEDLDHFYNELSSKEKKYFIDAYIMLSSYEYFDKYKIHYRISSQKINEHTYVRVHKKKNEK